MSPDSYLLMFAIGYFVCCFVTESTNPFKSTSWDQPKNLRTFGLSAWLGVALTPLFLDVLGVDKFENQILIGLLFAVAVSTIFCLGYSLVTRLSKFKQRRNRVKSGPDQNSETVEFASATRLQRKTIRSSNYYHRPAIVIDASKSDSSKAMHRRIKHKRVTGANRSLGLE